MSGRIARWLLQFKEFVSLLLLLGDFEAQIFQLSYPIESVSLCMKTCPAKRFARGSPKNGGLLSMTHLVVEEARHGFNIHSWWHQRFPRFQTRILYSNSEADYKALVIGLVSVLQMGVPKLGVRGYSKLVNRSMKNFPWRRVAPSYQTVVQKLIRSFSHI